MNINFEERSIKNAKAELSEKREGSDERREISENPATNALFSYNVLIKRREAVVKQWAGNNAFPREVVTVKQGLR